MKLLLINIKELLQVREDGTQKVSGAAMDQLPSLKNAYLFIKGGTIADYGSMEKLPPFEGFKTIDCSGKIVLPTWCDSHTHLIYAGNREHEFVDRIKGLTYQEIAEKGGGILNSAEKLQKTSEEDLLKQASIRLEEVMKLGTGAIEIKSGYGLTTQAELKMLRVAKTLAKKYPITIAPTFLGAHAVPKEFKGNTDAYVEHICTQMLPRVAKAKLAKYIDVFCEEGYFSVAQTDKLLTAAKSFGLVPKIHVNQFNSIGGIKTAVAHNALTVDHLEVLSDADMEILKQGDTMPVALPGCSFFLGIPYTPGRALIDAGLPLALATDYNPGSAPSGNMNFVVAAACIKMKLTPAEAINAATINGAYAMGVSQTHGSITKGKSASLIITQKIPSYHYLPYSFGSNLIDTVLINGKKV
ncbi:MAG: imidazolonepropionase [Flavobacteriaceae bacterium]|nr:imidazolonepropionase [Flavobacteriaceae bacterium]